MSIIKNPTAKERRHQMKILSDMLIAAEKYSREYVPLMMLLGGNASTPGVESQIRDAIWQLDLMRSQL